MSVIVGSPIVYRSIFFFAARDCRYLLSPNRKTIRGAQVLQNGFTVLRIATRLLPRVAQVLQNCFWVQNVPNKVAGYARITRKNGKNVPFFCAFFNIFVPFLVIWVSF